MDPVCGSGCTWTGRPCWLLRELLVRGRNAASFSCVSPLSTGVFGRGCCFGCVRGTRCGCRRRQFSMQMRISRGDCSALHRPFGSAAVICREHKPVSGRVRSEHSQPHIITGLRKNQAVSRMFGDSHNLHPKSLGEIPCNLFRVFEYRGKIGMFRGT